MDAVLYGQSGKSLKKPEGIAYTGQFYDFFKQYDGKSYYMMLLLSSGTLSIASGKSYAADASGIGGGGGGYGYCGGGSGYMDEKYGLTLSGEIVCTIGAGGLFGANGGTTQLLTLSAAGGLKPSILPNTAGGNGGNGGGAGIRTTGHAIYSGVGGTNGGNGGAAGTQESPASVAGGTGSGRAHTVFGENVEGEAGEVLEPFEYADYFVVRTGSGGAGIFGVSGSGLSDKQAGASGYGAGGGGLTDSGSGKNANGSDGCIFVRIPI